MSPLAASMSDPMIAGGDSLNSLLLGPRTENSKGRGVEIEKGMGFFPYGFTDQHFLRRGRFGRLVVALCTRSRPLMGSSASLASRPWLRLRRAVTPRCR